MSAMDFSLFGDYDKLPESLHAFFYFALSFRYFY